MRVIIEIETPDAGTCTWVLPEGAAAIIAALPDAEIQALALKRLQAVLNVHLCLLGCAVQLEDIFDALELVGNSEVKLAGTIHMMI